MNEGGVPKLRFPDFTDAWAHTNLGEVSGVPDYGLNAAAGPFDGKHKYIRITDIDEDSRTFKPSPLTSPRARDLEEAKLNDGDLVFARTGAGTGRSYLYDMKDGDLYFAGFLIRFPITLASPKFIFEQTARSEFRNWVQVFSARSGQPGINAKEYAQFSFFAPKLIEQKKIAAFLSTIDTKLAAVEAQLAGWREYKSGMMQALFSQRLRFKADDGSNFPDWEQKHLGKCFTERSERGHDDLLLLAVTMHRGVIDRNELAKGDTSSKDKSNYKRVDVDDIAYNSMRMWQGASGRSQLEGIISPAYTVITPTEKADPEFFAFLFKWKPMIFDFQRHSQGLTSDTWNLKFPALSKIKVVVPTSPLEQRKIADALSTIDSKIDALNQRLYAIREFKRGLLQKMFV